MLKRTQVCAGLLALGLVPAALFAQTNPEPEPEPENPTQSAPAASSSSSSTTASTDTGWGKAGYNKGFSFASADKQFTLKIGSRIQARYTQTDPEVGDEVGSFRIRRMKTSFEGLAFGDWKYKIQANWVGSNVVSGVTQSSSGAVTQTRFRGAILEDAQVEFIRNPLAVPWIGQGKAFFGRQQLISSGRQQFVDRSIVDDRFAANRHQGIGLTGAPESKTWEYNLGVYNGNGINQETNDNDSFLYVGRAVWTPFGEVKLEESALDYTASPRLAIGVSGFKNTTGNTPANERDITRLNAEFVFRIQGLSLTGEYYTEENDPVVGASLDTDGYYAQVGYLFPNQKFEVAGRYAVISPDTAASTDQTEQRLALSYYFSKHDYKLQADYGTIENDATRAEDGELRVQLQLAF